jgi:hypothetical protein
MPAIPNGEPSCIAPAAYGTAARATDGSHPLAVQIHWPNYLAVVKEGKKLSEFDRTIT